MTTATKSDIINRLLDSYNADIEALGTALANVDDYRDVVATWEEQLQIIKAEAVAAGVEGKNEAERAANLAVLLADSDRWKLAQFERKKAESSLNHGRRTATILEHRLTMHRKACDLYAALYRGGSDA